MNVAKANVELVEEWWTEPGAGDQSMEDDHHGFWEDFIANAMDEDVSGKTILDFGCNQGGFLRALYQHMPFKDGVGVDLAKQSISVANERKGDMPLEYFAMTDITTLGRDRFDYVISTAVLFLIEDMDEHARQLASVIKPGGVYFGNFPDFWAKDSYKEMRDMINSNASVKVAHNRAEDIIGAFENHGFETRMKIMQPVNYFDITTNSSWYASVQDVIDMEYRHRYAFKFIKK